MALTNNYAAKQLHRRTLYSPLPMEPHNHNFRQPLHHFSSTLRLQSMLALMA